MERLDGLRAVAALAIVVSHAWLYAAPDGRPTPVGHELGLLLRQMPLGVTLLFALSGFLLYRPWVEATLGGGDRPAIGRYARNRFLRIAPAYIVILLFIGFVLRVALLRDADGTLFTGSFVGRPWTLIADALLVQGYLPQTLITGIGPAWSLTTEVAFYVLLPALGLLAARLGRGRAERGRVVAACTPVVIMLAVGWTGKFIAGWIIGPGTGPAPGYDADWASVIDRSILGNADLFAPGMLLAVVASLVHAGRWHLPRWWRAVAWITAIGVALGAAKFLADSIGESHRLSAYPYAAVTAIPCGLLVALAVLPGAGTSAPAFHRLLALRPIVAVGVVSYSVFLWNEPLARWLSQRGVTFSGSRGLVPNIVIVAAASVAAAAITYRFVERPAMRRRR
jgi:peptidoglycan/LPS O-acetylase OafA/YrhL